MATVTGNAVVRRSLVLEQQRRPRSNSRVWIWSACRTMRPSCRRWGIILPSVEASAYQSLIAQETTSTSAMQAVTSYEGSTAERFFPSMHFAANRRANPQKRERCPAQTVARSILGAWSALPFRTSTCVTCNQVNWLRAEVRLRAYSRRTLHDVLRIRKKRSISQSRQYPDRLRDGAGSRCRQNNHRGRRGRRTRCFSRKLTNIIFRIYAAVAPSPTTRAKRTASSSSTLKPCGWQSIAIKRAGTTGTHVDAPTSPPTMALPAKRSRRTKSRRAVGIIFDFEIPFGHVVGRHRELRRANRIGQGRVFHRRRCSARIVADRRISA